MSSLVFGVIVAAAAAILYNLSAVLQAMEARHVSTEYSLRPSLIGRLFSRPLWLLGTFLGFLGWPLQVLALGLAPLSVVQPTLSVGLIVLLAMGVKMLGEKVGVREIVSVIAIAGGVTGLAITAPPHVTSKLTLVNLIVSSAILGVVVIAPYLMRRGRTQGSVLIVFSAGFAYAITGITSDFIAGSITRQAWVTLVVALLLTAGAGVLALISEMTSLQLRPATQVVPMIFVAEVILPVIFAFAVGGEDLNATPAGGVLMLIFLAVVIIGAALLASSPAVAAAVRAGVEAEKKEKK